MKVMKKLATMLLTVCLIIPCFSILSYAANGTIVFSDPSGTAGQNVDVTGVVRTGGAAIGDADVNIVYDASMLEFISGDNVTQTEAGKLLYAGKGTGQGHELRYNIQFKALKEGTTKISVESYKAFLFSNERLNCTVGSATVTIAAGAPVAEPPAEPAPPAAQPTGVTVDVNGAAYQWSEAFTEQEIPAGYVKTTMKYEGEDRQVVQKETSGVVLAYLTDATGVSSFFLYNGENASFSPYAEIYVSDTASIILLPDDNTVKLPETYHKVDFDVEGIPAKAFQAWQDTKNTGFYVIYALDGTGAKSLYQYDVQEGTYQRFIQPEVEKEDTQKGFSGKMLAFVDEHLSTAIIIGWGALLILLLLVIVLAMKLHNRNAELDEWYDEYGDNAEKKAVSEEKRPSERPVQQEKQVKQTKKEKKNFLSKNEEESEETFRIDHFELGNFDEMDKEDDTPIEDFEDDEFVEEDFPEEDFEDEDLLEEQDDGFFQEKEDRAYDALEDAPRKKKSSLEDFDVDFIDLDD